MFQNQKNGFVPEVTQAKEIQKSASMELQKWSENMGNVKNCNFFEGKMQVFVTYLTKMKLVTMLYRVFPAG